MDLDLDEVPSVLESYLYIKRQASDCVVLKKKTIGWHPIASLVLVYSLADTFWSFAFGTFAFSIKKSV